jgi:replicative DNA helicase
MSNEDRKISDIMIAKRRRKSNIEVQITHQNGTSKFSQINDMRRG